MYILKFNYMKKVLLVVIPMAIFVFNANAQFFSYGIKMGVNYSTITNLKEIQIPSSVQILEGSGNNSYRFGYNAGAFFRISLLNILAIQPEILYSNQGVKSSGKITGSDVDYSSTIKLDYINIPVILQIYLIPNILNLEVGPQLGFLINSKQSYEFSLNNNDYDQTSKISGVNDVDLSLALGLGIKIPLIPVGVNARYTFGLTDTYTEVDNAKSTRNGVFQLSVFVRL